MSNTKKSLLNENTIRRFMKLAEINTLSDSFVSGLCEAKETVKEQEEFDTGEEADGVTGPPEAELDAELDIEEPEVEDESAALTDAVSNLMGVISDMTGVDIDVDGGEEELPGEDELVDVDVEDELDVMAEKSEGLPSGDPLGIRRAEKVGRQQQEENLQRQANYRYALKNEVRRRVTARLQQESRKDAMADQLSERILQRIKNRR